MRLDEWMRLVKTYKMEIPLWCTKPQQIKRHFPALFLDVIDVSMRLLHSSLKGRGNTVTQYSCTVY